MWRHTLPVMRGRILRVTDGASWGKSLLSTVAVVKYVAFFAFDVELMDSTGLMGCMASYKHTHPTEKTINESDRRVGKIRKKKRLGLPSDWRPGGGG